MRFRGGARALLASTLLTACSTGAPASPQRPAAVDASVDASLVDAATPVEAGADGDDAGPFEGYEGSIAYDGCAATGTCPPALAVELAGGQASPGGIAVDDTRVYWVDLGWDPPDGGVRPGSSVMACAKTGCAGGPTVLATGAWAGASKLGVDDAGVYWILSGSVLACPLAGCAGDPTVLWSGTGPLYDIAVDPTGVYFTSRGTGQLLRCPPTGCDGGGVLLPSPDGGDPFTQPSAIALDGTSVYFVDSNSNAVRACDESDCAGTLRVVASGSGGTLAQIAVDDAGVYVTDVLQGRILSAPKAGTQGVLSVLVDNLSFPVGLASDGTSVFYTDTVTTATTFDAGQGGEGRVASCSVRGCGGIGHPIAGFVNSPLDLAVDATHVYWTDFGSSSQPDQSDAGRVMTFAK